MTSVSALAGDRLAHALLPYADDDELRAPLLPFVEAGLEAGHPVLVVAGTRTRSLLLDHFGEGVKDFALFLNADDVWVGGSQTMGWYRDALRPLLGAGRPCRVVAEPTWMAHPWGAVWSRYDAVVNELFADQPCQILCLHDRRAFPASLLEEGLCVHPLVWDGTQAVASPSYLPTDEFLRRVEPSWDPAPQRRERHTVTAAAQARAMVSSALSGWAPEGLQDDVLLAVNELVSNAVRAAGAAEVSHWRDGVAMVWEVADDGPGMHQTTAGYVPPPAEELGGRGLWIARTLADDAVVRPHGPGTAIRLFFARP